MASFAFLFCLFYEQLTVNMFNISCRCMDSNPSPLESEATALPTASQPLPYKRTFSSRHLWQVFEKWLLLNCALWPVVAFDACLGIQKWPPPLMANEIWLHPVVLCFWAITCNSISKFYSSMTVEENHAPKRVLLKIGQNIPTMNQVILHNNFSLKKINRAGEYLCDQICQNFKKCSF